MNIDTIINLPLNNLDTLLKELNKLRSEYDTIAKKVNKGNVSDINKVRYQLNELKKRMTSVVRRLTQNCLFSGIFG